MRFQRREREEPHLDMTSLIDVVFLLLIFFMVSTTFERETQINVRLPEASGEPLQSQNKVVEITIDAKGHYYVNRQEVVNAQFDTLKRALQEAAQGSKEPQVILSADRMTPHEYVITAMDAASQAGLVNLTFATAQPKGGQ